MRKSIDNNLDITCLGLMSGTSLDGLDLCLVSFRSEQKKWIYDIKAFKTITYDLEMKTNLSNAETLSGKDLLQLHNEFGRFIGSQSVDFIKKTGIHPQFIASHGHTVFHQPTHRYTLQIGSGAAIAAATNITTISDFRSLDIALGGQGAPLVPVGDEYLFNEYDYCLNLGGFANISTKKNGNRIAFDVCPLNVALNRISQSIGFEYDDGGEIAAKGKVHQKLLAELNSLAFYHTEGPKSLGKEWFLQDFVPIINNFSLEIEDVLCTLCEHFAFQLSRCVKKDKTVLVTGGGAYNSYFITRFEALSKASLVLPDDATIQFKEALIFAFLGLLRMERITNTLHSVTGASIDSVGGSVFYMPE